MQLKPGDRLGPYEIVATAGAGGMGEVYRARDTRLGRDVAVKILPAEFAQDAHLNSRFEREAKTISQLSHPNICTLFDVGRHGDSEFLVMEYLDGETLAQRIEKGPLPILQVLRYGSQIAEALDVAHRRGIIHRDVKPSNVMLTRTGVKVLDFGLARHAVKPAQAGDQTATEQKPLTQDGVIIGTVQYMAPEQLEGREADARTDIFAIGAVLYEMTSGRRPFQGTSRANLIAAIMHDDPPPISTQQPLTPPALDHVVRKCLEKTPDDRWQSAHDVAEELKWISETGSGARAMVGPLAPRRRWALLGILAAITVLAAAALAVWLARPRSVPVPRLESAIVAPEGTRFSLSSGPMALSPDGSKLAFVARDSQGKAQIWIRPLASSEAASVGGTEGASSPFWSPDGRYLGFFADHKLKKVPIEGGVPEVLSDVGGSYGGTWGSEGVIVFAGTSGTRLLKIPASGGRPEPITSEVSLHHYARPSFLPDGRRFLFTNFRPQKEPEGIYVGSIDSKATTMVVSGVYFNATYTPGFLLYSRSGALWAQRFDLRRLKISGEPIRIADRVVYDGSRAAALFSASTNGLVVYAGGSGGLHHLVWVDRNGKQLGTVGPPGVYYHPRLSPDQKRLALDWSDPINAKGDIWIFDLTRNVPTRFTYDPANETAPVWSPDGSRIIYMVDDPSMISRVFEKASSGAGHERALPKLDGMFPTDWSRDGELLAMSIWHRGSPDVDIAIATPAGKVQRWLETPFVEGLANFSPDGRWIAYMSEESGQPEVYVQSFPHPGTKAQVSQDGGNAPAWRGDGRELYYVSEDSKMMAVPLRIGEQFEAGAPIVLFDAQVRRLRSALRQYDVTADGQRFILNRSPEAEAALPMTLIQNWMPRD